jgi:trehalose-phosphatase
MQIESSDGGSGPDDAGGRLGPRRRAPGSQRGFSSAARLSPASAASLEGRPGVVVVIDCDGALGSEHPFESVRDPMIRESVAAIARVVPVGIVGRGDVDDLRRLVGLGGIAYAGCDGLDIRDPDGSEPEDGPGARFSHLVELFDRAERGLRKGLEGADPGVFVDRTRFGLEVGFEPAPEAARLVRGAAREVARHFPELQLAPRPAGYRFVPKISWDRGSALRWIVDRAGYDDPFPVHLGGTAEDEAAFRVTRRRGLGVLVGDGRRRTAARARLTGPEEVAGFLQEAAAVLASGHPHV